MSQPPALDADQPKATSSTPLARNPACRFAICRHLRCRNWTTRDSQGSPAIPTARRTSPAAQVPTKGNGYPRDEAGTAAHARQGKRSRTSRPDFGTAAAKTRSVLRQSCKGSGLNHDGRLPTTLTARCRRSHYGGRAKPARSSHLYGQPRASRGSPRARPRQGWARRRSIAPAGARLQRGDPARPLGPGMAGPVRGSCRHATDAIETSRQDAGSAPRRLEAVRARNFSRGQSGPEWASAVPLTACSGA